MISQKWETLFIFIFFASQSQFGGVGLEVDAGKQNKNKKEGKKI